MWSLFFDRSSRVYTLLLSLEGVKVSFNIKFTQTYHLTHNDDTVAIISY